MSLKLRLARAGTKKRPYYHIVLADARSPRDGRFIEKLGTYDPVLADASKRVTLLNERAQRHNAAGDLVQLYVAPPATYSESTGAPYGAGHCVFSDEQREGLISTLDSWVRDQAYPVPSGVAARFGKGLDPAFTPAAWPAGAVS